MKNLELNMTLMSKTIKLMSLQIKSIDEILSEDKRKEYSKILNNKMKELENTEEYKIQEKLIESLLTS